jgi:hypothetical protein
MSWRLKTYENTETDCRGDSEHSQRHVFIAWYRSAQLVRAGAGVGAVGIAFGIIAIAGGILAVRRKAWGLALAGAPALSSRPHPWGYLIWTPVVGILAVVLVASSKGEFGQN